MKRKFVLCYQNKTQGWNISEEQSLNQYKKEYFLMETKFSYSLCNFCLSSAKIDVLLIWSFFSPVPFKNNFISCRSVTDLHFKVPSRFGGFCYLVFEVTANFLFSLAWHVMFSENSEKSQPYKQKPRAFVCKMVCGATFYTDFASQISYPFGNSLTC